MGRTGRDLSPPNPESRQKLSKKNGITLVGYTYRSKNYIKIPPSPLLSDFSELAPPLVSPDCLFVFVTLFILYHSSSFLHIYNIHRKLI